jgi:hypothetical protein
VSAAVRHLQSAALVAVVALVAVACASPAGPLGTPASPVTSSAASGEPDPSDVAPASGSPSGGPSADASAEPSVGGSTEPSADATREPATTSPGDTPTATPKPAASPAGRAIVRAYFMLGSNTGNPGLVPSLREVPDTKALARTALGELLAGPQGAELKGSPAMYSGIPDGTTLADVTIADRVATVVLSDAFGSADATFQGAAARAQVVFTLTQFSTVRSVRIAVGSGSPEAAVGRSDFQEIGILPAIFVDRPAWGAAGGNPMTVSGIANVFEATFRVEVLDARGNVLADEQVQASCGTGCWGTFKKTVPYTVTKGQYGKLRVFDLSAKDGTPENVTEYRVWLTP